MWHWQVSLGWFKSDGEKPEIVFQAVSIELQCLKGVSKPCFGISWVWNRTYTKLIQQKELQIKKQTVSHLVCPCSVNSKYQSCSNHSIKKALHFIITRSYLHLCWIFLVTGQVELYCFFVRFTLPPHRCQVCTSPQGVTAFFPRLDSNCSGLCKARSNQSPSGCWPKVLSRGIMWPSHHPTSKTILKK